MRYVLRRLLWMIPVLWAAATIIWVFMFLIPGDPARVLAGQRADPDVLARVRADWGLDRPAPVRYGLYMWRLAHLDLGRSYVHDLPVTSLIADGMTRTFFLALTATLLAAGLGLLMGALAAARPGGAADNLIRLVSTAGISLPTFWLGMMLMLVFSSRLGWFPVSGYGQGPVLLGVQLPGPLHLVLPSVTLAVFSSGYISRVARASLLEEAGREYARAARARGASRWVTLLRHAMANALLPVVTMIGLNFGYLLGGAIATESVFSWPGMGLVMLRALGNRDLPVVEGGAIVLTASFLLVNLLVDVVTTWLDPRTRV